MTKPVKIGSSFEATLLAPVVNTKTTGLAFQDELFPLHSIFTNILEKDCCYVNFFTSYITMCGKLTFSNVFWILFFRCLRSLPFTAFVGVNGSMLFQNEQ